MQNLLYRWLLAVGFGHVVLGVVLAFAVHLPITQPYFDYLHASVAALPPSVEFQGLLRTLVGLFGPTVASWGVLFCVLVMLYRRHGHRQIKPAIFFALAGDSTMTSLLPGATRALLRPVCRGFVAARDTGPRASP